MRRLPTAVTRAVSRVADVTVVDTASGALREHRDLWLEGGRVRAISATSHSHARSRRSLSGRGLYALPGLIDTHVHALGLLLDVSPTAADVPWILRQQLANLGAFLRAGVTTIRDMGAPLHLIRWLSGLSTRGLIEAPQILFAGPVFSVPGGYPYFVPPTTRSLELTLGPIVVRLEGQAQARAALRRLKRAGVQCIKLCLQSAQYDDLRTPLPVVPRDLRLTLVEEAHALGLPVAAHHIFLDDLLEDLDIPYDALEHLPIDAPIPEEAVSRIAARRVPISTTLMTYGLVDHLEAYRALLEHPEGRFMPRPAAFLRETVEALSEGVTAMGYAGRDTISTGSLHQRESLARLHGAGALIVNGTDQGGAITPPGNPQWELADMVRAGLTPLEALRTATVDAALALGRPELGRLEPGAAADLLLVESNPLDDIANLGKVSAVIRAGRLVFDRQARRA